MTKIATAIRQRSNILALERLPAVSAALLLGSFLAFGIAFAGPMELHNAAHDGRHVFAFPCH